MKVKIFWKWKSTKDLLNKSKNSLEELWLSDFIEIEETNDSKLKQKLKITKEPALVIEEQEIDFIDTIFEWIVPEEEEIKSMFMSIVWGWETGGCGSWWWCSSCWPNGCG